jgi:hypothetical protein
MLLPGGLRGAKTDPRVAEKLYSIWSDGKEEALKRASSRDLSTMERQGLVSVRSGSVEVTSKGAEVLRQMILGDDRSSFEKKPRNMTYAQALTNIRRGVASQGKTSSSKPMPMNWYERAVF